MTRGTIAVFGTVTMIVFGLGIGRHVALAQGRGGGRGGAAGAPQGDPAKINVTPYMYDTKLLLSISVPPDNVYRGRTIWLERCALCHDGVGQPSYHTMGPWIGAETVQTVGETPMRAIVNAGTQRMPGYRYTLKPGQMDDLFAFLKTVGPDQKPTAAQLAAGGGGGGAAGGGRGNVGNNGE
jgi:mono/diheme cytochrome c family protein